MEQELPGEEFSPFRLFTRDSLFNIEKRIAEEKAAAKAEVEGLAAELEEDGEDVEPAHSEEHHPRKPNTKLEVGKKLPPSLEEYFPVELIGKPIEDIDEYYQYKKTCCVIAKDKTIFRFSATNAMFILSIFNPLRRLAIYVLVHPLFSAMVILTIIVNCIFMTYPSNKTPGGNVTETVFTAIYTVEFLVKITARGFVLTDFTYLRDPWNWLDCGVIAIAYLTMVVKTLGNLSALRTFRVLRALKTVAVVPGLKTIVGALLVAVVRLRDVMILTSFVLSIFALIGMQVYMGNLRNHCIKPWPENSTDANYSEHVKNLENWFNNDQNFICGNNTGAGQCQEGFLCIADLPYNPNYGYTNFDNFGWALLCAFRLMTQDYWENLYSLILRAEGPWHSIYFILVILLGSFYLVNLILAIVAMSYAEQQKQDKADADEEKAERQIEVDRKKEEDQEIKEILSQLTKSPSEFSCKTVQEQERMSIQSEKPIEDSLALMEKKPSFSLPGSPYIRRKPSGSLLRKPKHPILNAERQPLVAPYLEGLNLPYADDSNAVTPSSDDLCNITSQKFALLAHRGSFGSSLRRALRDGRVSRRSSTASQRNGSIRHSTNSPVDNRLAQLENALKIKGHHLLPDVIVDKSKLDDNETDSCLSNGDTSKKIGKGGNSPVCRAPSVTNVDHKDVMLLNDMLDHMSRRKSFVSIASIEKEPLKDKVWRIVNSWECPWWWQNYVQKYAALFVLDAFVDLFITLCILVNTVFMAMDYHGISKEMITTLERGNQVFSYIFAVEAFLKIIALGLFKYLKDGWNCFDIFIVLLSFLELLLEGVQGLSVLRTFRLLRVFKLAKSWPTLNMLISIVARTMGALGNLTFVLGIVVFIFAVMGQQLFGEDYNKYVELFKEDLPRWNFTDFMHSFMIVFRVLCGEWIESMWGCMRVSSWPCVPFFLLTMVIGNLVVLNLFLALLLSSFGSENLSTGTDSGDEEPNKLAQAFDRFRRFGNWIKVNMIVCVKVKLSRSKKHHLPSSGVNGKEAFADGSVIGNGTVLDSQVAGDCGHISPSKTTVMDGDVPDGMHSEASTRPASRASLNEKKSLRSDSGSNLSSTSEGMENQSLKKVDADGEPEINEVDVEFVTYPDDCFCEICRKKCICCARVESTKIGMVWWKLRCMAYKLCEHKYFETFIISMIVMSSIALALEDYHLSSRPVLHDILRYCDKCFTFIFIGEMVIKWFAFGFKKYFTDAWCWLDFVIVGISIVMLAAESVGMSEVGAFKALRTLRALRPLRAVSRWEGMRVVVNALIKAIPAIFNVMLVCLVFWLIFGIVGVQLFSGKFYKCADADDIKLNRSEVANKTQCLELEKAGRNVSWVNAPINFDNVLNSYLALFQVATYKGWVDIMNDAIDIMGLDQQPEREVSIYFYLYFVLFIIFGSFFTLNLFIGVIIDNFNQQKKKAGGSLEMFMTEDQKKYYKAMKRMAAKSPIKAIPRPKAGGSLEMFMTDDQKKYYQAMKRMSSKSPQKSIPRPRFLPAAIIFDITTNQKFDIAIMVVIIMNMVTMTMEHYGQSAEFENVLHYVNITFICIFTMECVLKLIGLRWYYFKIPWNVFDFGVVVLSILALALARTMETFPVSPTLLRVIRVFRIGRILRLVKSAKGIRTLLFSLAVSLPALFNIGLLLFLVLSIYATFGMSFFMHVELTGGLDDVFNFRTFGSSVVTLFQMCTSAGWDGVLKGLMNEKDCNKNGTAENGHKSTCGSYPMAVLFLVTYLVISFLVVVNMYIAVILENFSQATEDVQQGLTPDDFDMYYEKWEKYDPKATQYITLSELSDFVDYLEDPLRVPKPNHFMLVKLDIPICEGDRVNCRDILDALTKHFLGTSDLGDMPIDLKERKKGAVLYQQISSTLIRQKEHYAARIIQRAFRIYKGRKDDGDQGDAKPPPSYDEIAIYIPMEMEDSIERMGTEDTDNTNSDETKSLEENRDIEMMQKEEEEELEGTDNINITPDQSTVEIDLRPDSDVVA